MLNTGVRGEDGEHHAACEVIRFVRGLAVRDVSRILGPSASFFLPLRPPDRLSLSPRMSPVGHGP